MDPFGTIVWRNHDVRLWRWFRFVYFIRTFIHYAETLISCTHETWAISSARFCLRWRNHARCDSNSLSQILRKDFLINRWACNDLTINNWFVRLKAGRLTMLAGSMFLQTSWYYLLEMIGLVMQKHGVQPLLQTNMFHTQCLHYALNHLAGLYCWFT